MLTVAKVTAAGAGGYAEYLEGRAEPTARGDYYLKDGERVEAPGRWAGGADWLGCDAELPVGGKVLRELMAVRNPRTGQALRPVGGNGEALAAIDATFSAPKSVSAAWALADGGLRERIEAAHERAIDRALGYATRTVAMVRERVDRQTVQRVTPAALLFRSWWWPAVAIALSMLTSSLVRRLRRSPRVAVEPPEPFAGRSQVRRCLRQRDSLPRVSGSLDSWVPWRRSRTVVPAAPRA